VGKYIKTPPRITERNKERGNKTVKAIIEDKNINIKRAIEKERKKERKKENY